MWEHGELCAMTFFANIINFKKWVKFNGVLQMICCENLFYFLKKMGIENVLKNIY